MVAIFLLLFSNAHYTELLLGDDGETRSSNAAIIEVVSFAQRDGGVKPQSSLNMTEKFLASGGQYNNNFSSLRWSYT